MKKVLLSLVLIVGFIAPSFGAICSSKMKLMIPGQVDLLYEILNAAEDIGQYNKLKRIDTTFTGSLGFFTINITFEGKCKRVQKARIEFLDSGEELEEELEEQEKSEED